MEDDDVDAVERCGREKKFGSGLHPFRARGKRSVKRGRAGERRRTVESENAREEEREATKEISVGTEVVGEW